MGDLHSQRNQKCLEKADKKYTRVNDLCDRVRNPSSNEPTRLLKWNKRGKDIRGKTKSNPVWEIGPALHRDDPSAWNAFEVQPSKKTYNNIDYEMINTRFLSYPSERPTSFPYDTTNDKKKPKDAFSIVYDEEVKIQNDLQNQIRKLKEYNVSKSKDPELYEKIQDLIRHLKMEEDIVGHTGYIDYIDADEIKKLYKQISDIEKEIIGYRNKQAIQQKLQQPPQTWGGWVKSFFIPKFPAETG